MADGAHSPLPFPSPSAILGDNAPTTPPASIRGGAGGGVAVPSLPSGKKDKQHARRPSKDTVKKIAAPRKAASAVDSKDAITAATINGNGGGIVPAAKPKQTKSRNGICLPITHTHTRTISSPRHTLFAARAEGDDDGDGKTRVLIEDSAQDASPAKRSD